MGGESSSLWASVLWASLLVGEFTGYLRILGVRLFNYPCRKIVAKLFLFLVLITTLYLRPMVADHIYYPNSAYIRLDILSRSQSAPNVGECGTKGKFYFDPTRAWLGISSVLSLK